jgi:hypothetical protein
MLARRSEFQNAEFAEVIAGDDNRAAYAFLGTQTAGDILCIDWDPRVGGLVFWKEDEALRSTVPQPQLVSAQTRMSAGAGCRAAEVTSSAKARSAGKSKYAGY